MQGKEEKQIRVVNSIDGGEVFVIAVTPEMKSSEPIAKDILKRCGGEIDLWKLYHAVKNGRHKEGDCYFSPSYNLMIKNIKSELFFIKIIQKFLVLEILHVVLPDHRVEIDVEFQTSQLRKVYGKIFSMVYDKQYRRVVSIVTVKSFTE